MFEAQWRTCPPRPAAASRCGPAPMNVTSMKPTPREPSTLSGGELSVRVACPCLILPVIKISARSIHTGTGLHQTGITRHAPSSTGGRTSAPGDRSLRLWPPNSHFQGSTSSPGCCGALSALSAPLAHGRPPCSCRSQKSRGLLHLYLCSV